MKTMSFFLSSPFAAAALLMLAAACPLAAQDRTEAAHERGTDLKSSGGATVTSGTVTPGTATPGTVTPGTVTSGVTTPGTVTQGTVTPGVVSASAGGRQVNVSAVEQTSISFHGANAEVKLGTQTLMVEKSKLLLDGKPLGDMPPETKKVEVTVKEGMLSVIGDGKELARAKLTPPIAE